MRGFETNKKMDMIRDTTNALGNTMQSFDRAAEILVKTCSPFGSDERLAVLGGENKMVEKGCVG